MTNNLDRKIDELELSIRVMNGLKSNNINTIEDLVKLTEGEILRTPNFGRKSLNEVKEVLSCMNLKLGMTEEERKKDIPKKYHGEGTLEERTFVPNWGEADYATYTIVYGAYAV